MQLMDMRREAHLAKEALADVRAKCDLLGSENSVLTDSLHEARSDAGKYERHAGAFRQQCDELQVVCSNQREELDAAKTAWKAEANARLDADDALSTLQNALDSLKVDRARLASELEECTHRRRAEAVLCSDDARSLRAENERLTFAADEARTELYSAETRHKASAELAAQQHHAALSELEGQIDQLRERLADAERRAEEAERSATANGSEVDQLRTRCDELASREGEAAGAAEAARSEAKAAAKGEMDDLRTREAASEQSLCKALDRAMDLAELVERLEKELDVSRSEVARLSEANHVLSVRLQAAAADAEARSMEAETREVLTRQNNELERQNKDLRRVVGNLMGRTGGEARPSP